MRQFEETKLYHIRNTRTNSKLVVGQLLHSGKEYNPFYGVYEKQDISKITMDPNFLFSVVTYYWHFARESTFEEVRRELFSSLPSRQKCLYVAAEKNLKYWIETLNYPEYQVVEVQIKGNIFKCDASLVEGNPKAIEKVRKDAMRYWQGEIVNSNKIEYLAEGDIKVVRILDKQEIRSLLKSGRLVTAF
ncbi:hypothetical protein COE51_23870 [Bacillus pseudomycoides]|nr:hypothetical protein COE51_23870 [Bacillus pseudomycoides]